MSTEQMTQHPIGHIEISPRGNSRRASFLLLRVLRGRTTSKLYSGCENAEGCLGKSEEDFWRKKHILKAPTPTGVEQLATTQLVGG